MIERTDEADLSCRELVELVTDYLEGRLPSPDRSRFEAHLVVCRPCVRYLEQMRQTIRLTGRLSEETIDSTAKHDLLVAFRAWKNSGRR